MTKARLFLLLAILVAVALFFGLGLHRYFTLEQLQASRARIVDWRDAEPLLASAAFFGVYVGVTAVSLPGAGIMTLAAGAIFGLAWGTLLVSFASAIGATLAFLAARFLVRDAIQRRFADRLRTVNDGVRRDGGFYLFTLRLIPIFPFFLINILMALTPMRARTFYWVSQVGMLPLTVVFVNAGTEIAKVGELGDIVSPTLIGSLVLVGLFPLAARKVLEKFNAKRKKA